MGGGGGSASPLTGGGGITVAQPIGGGTYAGPIDGGETGAGECENPTCAEMIGKRCGPDVTVWLMEQLKRNIARMREPRRRRRPAGSRREHELQNRSIPTAEDKFVDALLREWDWNNVDKGGGYSTGNGKVESECPRHCPRTVTLCGKCVVDYVPEDINFAVVGKAMGFSEWYLRAGAAYVYKMQQWQHTVLARFIAITDTAANIVLSGGSIGGDSNGESTFTIGFTLVTEDLDDMDKFCKKLKVPGALQSVDCPLCKEKFQGHNKNGG